MTTSRGNGRHRSGAVAALRAPVVAEPLRPPAHGNGASLAADALRREMCDVGRRVWSRGLCSGCEGNLSVRFGNDRVLCTPSGVSKGSVEPGMVRTLALDGTPLDPDDGFEVTSEIRVHLAVYRARPDVRAVVHSHAPNANAFAMAGVPLAEGVYPEAEIVLGRVPLVPYALPGTAALAGNVAAALTAHTSAMLLSHHGTLTMSTRGLLDAYHRLEVLESWCRILLGVARLGAVEVLSAPQRAEVLALKRAAHGLGDDREHEDAADFEARNRAVFAAMGVRATGGA